MCGGMIQSYSTHTKAQTGTTTKPAGSSGWRYQCVEGWSCSTVHTPGHKLEPPLNQPVPVVAGTNVWRDDPVVQYSTPGNKLELQAIFSKDVIFLLFFFLLLNSNLMPFLVAAMKTLRKPPPPNQLVPVVEHTNVEGWSCSTVHYAPRHKLDLRSYEILQIFE